MGVLYSAVLHESLVLPPGILKHHPCAYPSTFQASSSNHYATATPVPNSTSASGRRTLRDPCALHLQPGEQIQLLISALSSSLEAFTNLLQGQRPVFHCTR